MSDWCQILLGVICTSVLDFNRALLRMTASIFLLFRAARFGFVFYFLPACLHFLVIGIGVIRVVVPLVFFVVPIFVVVVIFIFFFPGVVLVVLVILVVASTFLPVIGVTLSVEFLLHSHASFLAATLPAVLLIGAKQTLNWSCSHHFEQN